MRAPGRALVTGANRGLGWWLTRALLARGWEVWGACRRPDLADELWSLDPIGVLPFDAARPDAAATLAEGLHAAGVDSLDLCVNNAGVKPAELRPELGVQGLHGLTSDLLVDVFRINAFTPVMVTQALLPLLERAPDGAVVAQISSNLASHERVVGDDLGYSASKAALNMFAHLLGRDLVARGVTVVAVSPGWVRTEMGGPHAPLEPEPTMDQLARTLETLGPERSGTFLDFTGAPVNW
jgi:NAD(P)-dependent dehydrogenase (short-subunit alcohol dehydrogenase family)